MSYGMRKSLRTEKGGERWTGRTFIEAHQMIHVGEAMRTMVNCMNTFRMYRPHVREFKMTDLIDRQLDHMMGMCNTILSYIQTKEINNIMPERIMNWKSNLSQMNQPINMNTSQLDDLDMVCCMTSSLKSCVMSLSVTIMACTDDTLRKMAMDCCSSCMNMVFDMSKYIRQRAPSQFSNMQTNVVLSPMNVYQPMSEMQYQ